MPARDSNSLLQLAHLKPNDSGNFFGPLGCLPPAPRRMLWMAFNLLQFPASGPINANCSETGTKHNTKNKRTTLCIATDVLLAWMCTHHGRNHILKGKKQKIQKIDLEMNENYIIKTIDGSIMVARRIAHSPNHNTRSRLLRNIQNAHEVTAK